MQELRYNTAVIISVGPFYDKGDGVSIETGLTITNEKITLIAETDDGNAPTLVLDNITGVASGTSNDLNYIANSDNGMMQLELSAANTQRYGRLKLSITDAANHVPVFHEFEVVSRAYYDAKYGTANLPAEVKAMANDVITAAAHDESTAFPLQFQDASATILARAGDKMDVIDAPNATGIGVVVAAIWNYLMTAITTTGSVGKLIKDCITGDTFARLGSPAGASHAADIAVIAAKTGNLPTSPAAIGSPMTLTAAYNAAKTASSQSSIETIDELVDLLITRLTATRAGYLDVLADLSNAGRLDTLIDAIKAKTDNLPTVPAAVGSAMTLTADYDACKTEADGIAFIVGRMGGRVRVVGNQQICYGADNVTEICRFDLKDAAGVPTMTSVYDKVRV